jgi:hypothetical protein
MPLQRPNLTNSYASPFRLWSVNGHTQSGGHWNVAFGLVVRSSGFLDSLGCWSESGEGTADGALLIMRDIPPNERKWRSNSH